MFDLVFYTKGKSAALLSEAWGMRLLWQKTKKKALFIKKKCYKAVDFYIVLVLEYRYRFSLFLSVVLRLNPRIYAVSFGFSNGSSQPMHPFLFPDFFSSFSSENDSREGTEKISAKLPTHYGIVSAQG